MIWKNKGHEFDELGKRLTDAAEIYLYGIGADAKELLQIFDGAEKWFHWDIHLIDKSEKLQYEGCNGRKVMSPDAFYAKAKGDYLVVTCPLSKVSEEIHGLLLEHGIPEKRVLSGFDFTFTCLPLYFLYRHNMVFFTSQSIVVSTVCNLNCRDCLNFTPYIKKHTIRTLDQLQEDVDLFFGAVEMIFRFQITGGEPLLYPHLAELLDYIDRNYRDKIIRLEMVTNGTVVPSDELCEILAEKKVFLFLDDYTLTLDTPMRKRREEIREKLKKFGVWFTDNFVERWFRMYPPVTQRDRAEKALVSLFDECKNPWSTIEDGRIAACNYSLYAAKAGVCGYHDADYYDLRNYASDKKAELVEFRVRCNQRGFTELCKMCEGYATINQNWAFPAIQEPKGACHEMDK